MRIAENTVKSATAPEVKQTAISVTKLPVYGFLKPITNLFEYVFLESNHYCLFGRGIIDFE